MLLPDVNILVSAFKEGSPDHPAIRNWLETLVNGDETYGVSDLVCSGFLRIVTNPRIFEPPSTLDEALAFLARVRDSQNCVLVNPGVRHWEIFVELCRSAGARGSLIPDAYHAAPAIESGSEWVTLDGDFARFRGLRWRRPIDS
jgi:uncharacterized protein